MAGGCVSVSGPSPAPSAASSLGITTPAPTTQSAKPSVAPTATAAATPSPESTLQVTPEASLETVPPASSKASGEPSESAAPAGADLLFDDDMSDPASGWATGQSGAVAVDYVDGSLELTISAAQQAVWSTRRLESGSPVVLVAGVFTPKNDESIFGPLCETPDGKLYGVIATSSSHLNFIAIEGDVTRVLASHDELGIEVPNGQPVSIGLECAGTDSGAFRMVASMSNGVLAVYQNTEEGPFFFDTVALYGESKGDSLVVNVDHAVAYGTADSDEMSPEGAALLTHVPGDLQQTCYEAPSSTSATAVIHCILQTEGTGAELLGFQSYDSNETMDAAYQEIVDQYGVESTESCQSGPGETTWNLDNAERGRIQCAPQQAGIRFDWTDNVLSILSTLIDFDGDYENTYSLWLNAGPVDNPI